MKIKHFMEKYYPLWFVFGETETHVDISDGTCDVLVKVSRAEVAGIIAARNTFISSIEEYVRRHPESTILRRYF